jgi:DNA-binding transcriptional ArsR family regulator
MKTTEIFSFFTEIGIIAQLSQTQFERLMPAGMTIAQFTVLNHCVRVGDGTSPARLARAFQVTKGTMTSTLHRLEQKGLVAIEADPEDGRAMRDSCIAATQPWAERIGAMPEASDMATLLPRLAALRAALDRDRN